MSREIFVRDLCGNVKTIFSSCEIEDIKYQIKTAFDISSSVYNIRVFLLDEEEKCYGFLVNNIEVNVRLDENIRVTVPLEKYNRYIVDIYGDLDEKVSFILYECISNLNEHRREVKTYYVDNKDCKVKFLGTPYNGTILISPFIDVNGRNLCKKLKKALMEGFSKNEVLKKRDACILEEICSIIEERIEKN